MISVSRLSGCSVVAAMVISTLSSSWCRYMESVDSGLTENVSWPYTNNIGQSAELHTRFATSAVSRHYLSHRRQYDKLEEQFTPIIGS